MIGFSKSQALQTLVKRLSHIPLDNLANVFASNGANEEIKKLSVYYECKHILGLYLAIEQKSNIMKILPSIKTSAHLRNSI